MYPKDVQQIIYDNLEIDDKYSFHLYSKKYFNDNIAFTVKVISDINDLNRSQWSTLCYKSKDINNTFIDDHLENIKWNVLSQFTKMNEEFIEKYMKYINMEHISYSQDLSERFIRKYSHKLDWNNISYKQKISFEFIKEFEDKIKWEMLSWNKYLSVETIRYFKDKLDWESLSEWYNMNSSFMIEFNKYINYEKIDLNLHLR